MEDSHKHWSPNALYVVVYFRDTGVGEITRLLYIRKTKSIYTNFVGLRVPAP